MRLMRLGAPNYLDLHQCRLKIDQELQHGQPGFWLKLIWSKIGARGGDVVLSFVRVAEWSR